MSKVSRTPEKIETFELHGFVLNGGDRDDTLLQLAAEMHNLGLVNENYGEAVIQRENEFPTGLPTLPFGTALPHSEKDFAVSSSVAVAKLNKPAIFRNMGAPEEELDVDIVFLLAVCKGEEQVPMIKTIMNIVQDGALLGKIYNAKTGKQIEEELKEYCTLEIY
jgi:PTS system galactitol-specific IIA component